MAVNTNLAVSDDQIIDFESRDMSNSQIGDILTSKSRKLTEWSFCEIWSNSKFHFLGPKIIFFQNRRVAQSQLIDFEQICLLRFLIFDFSKNRKVALFQVILTLQCNTNSNTTTSLSIYNHWHDYNLQSNSVNL